MDSGQSLSRKALGREHAGMTVWDNGHFILWRGTESRHSGERLILEVLEDLDDRSRPE